MCVWGGGGGGGGGVCAIISECVCVSMWWEGVVKQFHAVID